MSYTVSTATIDDLDHVAKLMDDYVRQNLNMPSWTCSIATFKRDYTSGCFRMTVIRSKRKLVGFAAWQPCYDLHHCVHGAQFIDLYVDPAYRCRGLGMALICAKPALYCLQSVSGVVHVWDSRERGGQHYFPPGSISASSTQTELTHFQASRYR
jgi:GNAT superfamily N-acetyltransferase